MSEKRKYPSEIYSVEERVQVWDDNGRMCHYCDRPLPRPGTKGGKATHFDHKQAHTKGGSHDLKNLVISCKVCNREKGNKPYRAYLYWKLRQAKTAAKRLQDLLDKS